MHKVNCYQSLLNISEEEVLIKLVLKTVDGLNSNYALR